jgi:hypothetical protein
MIWRISASTGTTSSPTSARSPCNRFGPRTSTRTSV